MSSRKRGNAITSIVVNDDVMEMLYDRIYSL